MDSYYGCATATLSVAPSISSCNTYLRHYYHGKVNGQCQGNTHPFISTPYCVLAAPVTREVLDDVARWSIPGPLLPPPPVRQTTGCSRTFCAQSSSISLSTVTAASPPPHLPTTTTPPQAARPPLMKAFSSDSFDQLSSSVSNIQRDQAATLVPPSASELFEHLQPQLGEGLLLLISEYCGDGTLEELIRRGGLSVGRPSASGSGASSLHSRRSNLVVVWDALLVLGQVAVAMSFLHEQGLPHGCLRASNVYLKHICGQDGAASEQSVFLTDVGLTTLMAMAGAVSDEPGAAGPLTARRAATATAAAAAAISNDVYDYGRLVYEVVFPGCSYSGGGLPPGRPQGRGV